MTCARDWELVAPAVGATCGTDAGTSDAASTDALRDREAPPEASPILDAPPGGSETRPEVLVEASGGACALAPFRRQKGTWGFSFSLAGLVAAGFRCRRRDQFLTIT